jgi:hypothetical protein
MTTKMVIAAVIVVLPLSHFFLANETNDPFTVIFLSGRKMTPTAAATAVPAYLYHYFCLQ